MSLYYHTFQIKNRPQFQAWPIAAASTNAKRLMAFSLGQTRAIVTCNPDVAKVILPPHVQPLRIGELANRGGRVRDVLKLASLNNMMC